MRTVPAPRLLRIARALILVWTALAMAGCAARQEVETGPTVKQITFEEQQRYFRWWRGTSDFSLRSAMEQQRSPTGAYLLAWVPRTELDTRTLSADAWRIELWYAHHGFFDARFDGWEVETARPPRRGHMPVVRVVGHVHEGEPSLVREVRFEGLTGPAGTAVLRRAQGRAALQAGDRFDLDAYKETADQLRQILRQQSYARAKVTSEVRAHPEENVVDVVYRAELGPPCRFGEVSVEGFATIPEVLIEHAITIESGKQFTTSALAKTQQNLFGLGVFSLVQVLPDLSGEGEVIPVTIKLSESKFRQLKLGPGVGVQSGEQLIRARLGFSHSNLFQRLLGLEFNTELGYKTFNEFDLFAESLDGTTSTEAPPGGPFVLAGGALNWPGVFGPRWTLRQELSTAFDREPGYEFVELSAVPSLSYQLTKHVTLVQAFHAEYKFLTFEEGFEDDEFCDELTERQCRQYSLLYPEQIVIWDARNDPLFTTRGYLIQLSLVEAGVGPLGGFSFYRGDLDLRRYLYLRRPFRSVLAGRVGLGAAWPYGDEADAFVPLEQRFYLGGASTVRGWSRNHLGPRTCYNADAGVVDCTTPPEADAGAVTDPNATITIVPTGARAATWGSLEWRIEGPYDLTFALFTDVGMAWAFIEDVDFSQLQPSAGGGFRYATPIGPARLDLAFRLKRDPEYVLDSGYAIHFALSEAF